MGTLRWPQQHESGVRPPIRLHGSHGHGVQKVEGELPPVDDAFSWVFGMFPRGLLRVSQRS